MLIHKTNQGGKNFIMSEKNLADLIQSLLEKNKGFMCATRLRDVVGSEARRVLGIKSKDSGKNVARKIEQVIPGKFMLHTKGSKAYILIPCEPLELVAGLLSPTKALDMRVVSGFPFTQAEFYELLNGLIDEGKAKVIFTDKGKPKIFGVEGVKAGRSESVKSVAGDEGYTVERFREAFDECDKGRIFVRICDIRRKLGWPRDVFDGMIRDLRDKRIIQLHTGDASLMTEDEVADCYIDENNFRMGTVTWHVR